MLVNIKLATKVSIFKVFTNIFTKFLPEDESEEWSGSRLSDSGFSIDLISLESSKLESFFKTPLSSLVSCSGEPMEGGNGLSGFRIPLGCSDSEKEARRESDEECLRIDRGLSRWASRDPPEPSRFRIPGKDVSLLELILF